MADPFEDAWLKWGWAIIEAEALEVDIDAFSKEFRSEGLGTVRCDYQPKHHRFAAILDAIHVDLPKRWGLRVGNIVHNYRSCLDHIAWQLVDRGTRPTASLTD